MSAGARQHPRDDPAQGVGHQQGVGVDRGEERRPHGTEAGVERFGLAAVGDLHDADPSVEPGEAFGDADGGVGRAVVDDGDGERPGVLLGERIGDRLGDVLLLVVGRQEQGQPGVVEVEVDRDRVIEQQRGDELDVEVSGDQGDPGDQGERDGERDAACEIVDPGPGDPGGEAHPDDPAEDAELEAGGDPQVGHPARRGVAPWDIAVASGGERVGSLDGRAGPAVMGWAPRGPGQWSALARWRTVQPAPGFPFEQDRTAEPAPVPGDDGAGTPDRDGRRDADAGRLGLGGQERVELAEPGEPLQGLPRAGGRGRDLDGGGAEEDADAGAILGEGGGGGLEDDLLGDPPDTGEHGEAPAVQAVGAAGTTDGAGELAGEPAQELVGGDGPVLDPVGRETRELEDRQEVRPRAVALPGEGPEVPEEPDVRAQAGDGIGERPEAPGGTPGASPPREGKLGPERRQQDSEGEGGQDERREMQLAEWDRGSQGRHSPPRIGRGRRFCDPCQSGCAAGSCGVARDFRSDRTRSRGACLSSEEAPRPADRAYGQKRMAEGDR